MSPLRHRYMLHSAALLAVSLASLLPIRLHADTGLASVPLPVSGTDTSQVYTFREASPGGTGKIYLGREISRVMSHAGASWLDRPARENEEQPQLLVNNLPLRPTDVVGDIGAGTGYFSFRISPLIPQGRCLAVDVQPEMIDILRQRIDERGVRNVVPILGSPTNPNLPESGVDLALMVDAYHEFFHPREMMTAIVQALKPGGLVVLVEYRGEDRAITRHPLHKMTQDQAIREMAAVGLRWKETRDILPQQHFMVFEKPQLLQKN
ncbi:MAG: class I SAM-dependent methyltransferase [Fidelibacterota bacterium]|nr:MAG: class I SAM-dependent methyltransferase [Candidatus Neomarinimicrobiota bacterium]